MQKALILGTQHLLRYLYYTTSRTIVKGENEIDVTGQLSVIRGLDGGVRQ